MALPGLSFFFLLGAAVVGMAYVYYNSATNQNSYNYDRSQSYSHYPSPPPRRVEYKRKRKNSVNTECTICLDVLSDDFQTLPCNHAFHRSCIQKWFDTDTKTCPNCRAHNI